MYFTIIVHCGNRRSCFFIENKIRTKEEKKRKFPDPEECSLCVFNPKECKKDKPKLRVLLEVSGNSKQTTINGDVSYFLYESQLINFVLQMVVTNNLHILELAFSVPTLYICGTCILILLL